jgi:hypothetical protein
MKVHRKAKKSTPQTTARQQSVIIEAPNAKLFLCKIDPYKCVMDAESFFTVEGNEWQQQS